MESSFTELQETLSYPFRIKVHVNLCNQLQSLVNRISIILPEIEAARPHCSSGIQALCQLRNAMELTTTLIQNCNNSSKLYLVLTGRKVVSRFEQTRKLLQKSLSQLRSMVPVILQSKISEILGDLGAARFSMDSHDEQVGKALRVLLHQDIMNPDRMSNVEAALKLHLSSQKDLLIERESITTLLDKVQEGNSTKRQALMYLLNLLENYGELIVKGQTNHLQTKNSRSHLFLESLESLENCDSLEFQPSEAEKGFSSVRKLSDIHSQKLRFFSSTQDIRRQFLSGVNKLPWTSQCRAVQDVQDYLADFSTPCNLSYDNFWNPLVQFLNDALDKHDKEAQKVGTQLLLIFFRSSRTGAIIVVEDVYAVLACFLETEAVAEIFSIMDFLSTQESAFPNFVSSKTLNSIIKFLDNGCNKEFQVAAIRILYNLSLSVDTCTIKCVTDWIPKLVQFLGDSLVAGICLSVLENLCKFKDARVSIAETDGCIESIIEILQAGSCEDQEHAVAILSSLCVEHKYYYHVAGHEDPVPCLVHVSVSGNEKGKVHALTLLRLFWDTRIEDDG